MPLLLVYNPISANVPITRFAPCLRHDGKFTEYLAILRAAFNPATSDNLMCRNTLNISWRGEAYDSDFNQQLALQQRGPCPQCLWDIDPAALKGHEIALGEHCLGCTVGASSSCNGAVAEP